MNEYLFSYGTLQLESVQLATFHRLLEGQPDSILGYSLDLVEIKDLDVIKKSGKTHHPIIKFTGNLQDEVEGVVFKVTMDEIHQSDRYETSDYKRISAPLKSGGTAWVYIAH